MQSWSWPNGPEFIAEVFLVQGWAKDVAKVNLDDLSTALGLWNNCTVYNIQPNTSKKLREVRNAYVAHNPKSEVSDDKLTKIFMVLGVLFRDADLKNFIDENKCLQELDEIKQKKDDRFDDLLAKVDSLSGDLDKVLDYIRETVRKEMTTSIGRHKRTIMIAFLLAFLTLLLTGLYVLRLNIQNETHPEPKRIHRKYTTIIQSIFIISSPEPEAHKVRL